LRSIRVAETEPIRVVVSHEDITALKLAEEALRKREIERDQLRHSLELAKEVQQILLPGENPQITGLEVAGKSIYCDETGGDYYDFIKIGTAGQETLGVVVGDVAGHGISSALLMATTRSAIRQRAALPGSPAQIISDVNRQLVDDFADSGQFVTLFFLSVDPTDGVLEWVRAGHDPAICYDPTIDLFSELGGKGIALGVDPESRYEQYRIDQIAPGSVIVICTDGAWEIRNEKGEMFGRKPLCDIVRRHAKDSAESILNSMIDRIKAFQQTHEFEDDITLVVLKLHD
jgi:sigma-B regulation protein RsbU (phosphoserine phosphatase)